MIYVHKYRDNLYRIVSINTNISPGSDPLDQLETVNEGKTADNLRRAARTIEALALCNPWEWFGTFTLDPRKYDRLNLDQFRIDFNQFVRDTRKRTGCRLPFLTVPELHRNREGWHLHGLLDDLPLSELRPFTLDESLPVYLREKIKRGELVYDWPAYRKRFGWVDIEPIKNRDAAARYVSKYITKGQELTANALQLHKHLYYASKGLLRPVTVWTHTATMENAKAASCALAALPRGGRIEFAFEYEYGSVYWYSL